MYVSTCPCEHAPIAVLSELQDIGPGVKDSLLMWPQLESAHLFIKGLPATLCINRLVACLLDANTLPGSDGKANVGGDIEDGDVQSLKVTC